MLNLLLSRRKIWQCGKSDDPHRYCTIFHVLLLFSFSLTFKYSPKEGPLQLQTALRNTAFGENGTLVSLLNGFQIFLVFFVQPFDKISATLCVGRWAASQTFTRVDAFNRKILGFHSLVVFINKLVPQTCLSTINSFHLRINVIHYPLDAVRIFRIYLSHDTSI